MILEIYLLNNLFSWNFFDQLHLEIFNGIWDPIFRLLGIRDVSALDKVFDNASISRQAYD